MSTLVPDENSMEDSCATPASGAWSAWTMSHPTQMLHGLLDEQRHEGHPGSPSGNEAESQPTDLESRRQAHEENASHPRRKKPAPGGAHDEERRPTPLQAAEGSSAPGSGWRRAVCLFLDDSAAGRKLCQRSPTHYVYRATDHVLVWRPFAVADIAETFISRSQLDVATASVTSPTRPPRGL